MWNAPWTSRSITSSSAFQRWFGNSVVRNPDGSPRVVYHGTYAPENFSTFQRARGDIGIHIGTQRAANRRLEMFWDHVENLLDLGYHPAPRVMPVYASIQNPIRLEDDAEWGGDIVISQLEYYGMISPEELAWFRANRRDPDSAAVALLRRRGHDGIVYRNYTEDDGSDSYAVFDPSQIKSATGNRGTFDPNDPDILHGWR